MHLLDCKGATALVIGGILNTLLRDGRLGNCQQARLNSINARALDWYKQRPGWIRLPKLLLSNCTGAEGWSVLSGKAIKAANTRHSVPFWKHLVHELYGDMAGPEYTSLCGVIDGLDEIYAVLYVEPMFLDAAAMARLRAACLSFGRCYQKLREVHRRASSFAFNVTPKIHKVQHLPLLASCVNPRYVQTYGEESLIGTSCRTYAGSMSGRYARTIQRTFLYKRLAALPLRFELPSDGRGAYEVWHPRQDTARD